MMLHSLKLAAAATAPAASRAGGGGGALLLLMRRATFDTKKADDNPGAAGSATTQSLSKDGARGSGTVRHAFPTLAGGTCLPADANLQAARDGQPAFHGSGQAFDVQQQQQQQQQKEPAGAAMQEACGRRHWNTAGTGCGCFPAMPYLRQSHLHRAAFPATATANATNQAEAASNQEGEAPSSIQPATNPDHGDNSSTASPARRPAPNPAPDTGYVRAAEPHDAYREQ